jgi:flagellin-like protein
MINKKRALSELVAYVILIGITISLSVIVYAWLKGYVAFGEAKECPEGVNLVIKDYNLQWIGALPDDYQILNITIQNKGLFTADGFIIKINDKIGSTIGIYTLSNSSNYNDRYGVKLAPDQEYNFAYILKNQSFDSEGIKKDLTGSGIKFIEVQPFVRESVKSAEIVYCRQISTQSIN